MLVTEEETGLRELGKVVQDLVLAHYSENMSAANTHINEMFAIFEQLAGSEYHITLFLRLTYPPSLPEQQGDTIDRALFSIHTNGDDVECMDVHHAKVIVTLLINETDEIIGKGNIHVHNEPLEFIDQDPDNSYFFPTESFDEMLATINRRKHEQGH